MNRLTSTQRKVIYALGIVLLMLATILLGRPSSGGDDVGGVLPRMRVEYDLGESTLGDVDPSSATMNLVLLGMRGIAANVLWMEHEELKKTKNWGRMKATVDSIITLQPHFLQVWRYHGWDLAYNVSAEWDAVEDRYYWVKEGTKFTMRGVRQNVNYAELPWEVGRLTGHKIGRSDEWRFFREFFLADPDQKFEGEPDPEINREKEDNYLVARQWFLDANVVEQERHQQKKKGQAIMMRELFRHYPSRSYFDLADALHREGNFGENTQYYWEKAYEDWGNVYGKERFEQTEGGIYWLNPANEGDLLAMIKEDQEQGRTVDLETKKFWVNQRQNVTNFRYWLARSLMEKQNDMMLAHREMYEARQEFKLRDRFWNADGTPPDSIEKLLRGMRRFERMIEQFGQTEVEEIDKLAKDDNLIEEAMLAVYYFRVAHVLNDLPLPDDYPLKEIWDENQDRVEQIEREFQRELGGSLGD